MKTTILTALTLSASVLFAQEGARNAYLQQQAVQEVQRLSAQFDQLNENQEAIVSRLVRLEKGDSSADIKAEIGALKAQIAEIKREQASMRQEIVAEISKKMATLIAKAVPPPPPPPPPQVASAPSRKPTQAKPAPAVPVGPHYEHVVEAGQTLSLIAKGYETTTQKILNANPGLKPNSLRVGQKLIIPAEEEKK